LLFDRRAREADERGVRERVAHVARVAVNEVVLAAVRLVCDHDDVPATGQQRVAVPLLLREELLDRGEHDAARLDRQQAPQVGAAVRLHRRLAQQVPAPRERPEQLVVQVVAVGQHHDGRVPHRGLSDDPARVEDHRQALAGPLRVPHHADAPVAGRTAGLGPGLVARGGLPDALALQLGRAQRLLDRDPHGVELVVARDLLDRRPAAGLLEHDEVPDQVQEPPRREDPLDHDRKFRNGRVGHPVPRDRAPGLEPLAAGADHPDARLHPVGHHEHRVRGEQARDLGLVGLELPEGRPDRGVRVRGVLQFDHGEWQAVHEQHHVGAPFMPVLHHGELVHGEPVVPRGVVEVDHAGLGAPDASVRVPVLDGHPLHDHPVRGAVPVQ